MKFITTSNNIPGFSMTRMYLVPCKFFWSQYCLADDVRKQNLPICTEFESSHISIAIQLFLPVECSKLLSLSDKYSIQRELVFHTLNFTCSCCRCFFPVQYYNIFQLQHLPRPPPLVLHFFRNYHETFCTDLCYITICYYSPPF